MKSIARVLILMCTAAAIGSCVMPSDLLEIRNANNEMSVKIQSEIAKVKDVAFFSA